MEHTISIKELEFFQAAFGNGTIPITRDQLTEDAELYQRVSSAFEACRGITVQVETRFAPVMAKMVYSGVRS